MTNISKFTSQLSNSISSELLSILKALWSHQKEVYIVGGAVRDCLLGFPVKDFDVTTNARPKEIELILRNVGIKSKPIGGKFGTILAIIGRDAVYDVSTFRREIYPISGSPEVIFVDSLEEDLIRRDFRFNAIAFDPKQKEFIDRYDGFLDLQRGRIRAIGDAYTRLVEDGTRIIRLARFASKFNFQIHHDLISATRTIGKKATFFSYTRLKKEFYKFLMLPDLTKGLHLLWDAGILAAMFPNFPFLNYRANGVNPGKIVNKFREFTTQDIILKLFALLLFFSEEKDHNQDVWHLVSQDFKMTVKEQKKLSHLLNSWLNFPKFSDYKRLKRWIRATGINTCENLLHLVFLLAELKDNSEILSKRKAILKETSAILKAFR